jgi:Mg2+ and Co2+ transporter CorA
MDFEHMPELHWVAGYPLSLSLSLSLSRALSLSLSLSLSLMLVTSTLLYFVLRRRGWL